MPPEDITKILVELAEIRSDQKHHSEELTRVRNAQTKIFERLDNLPCRVHEEKIKNNRRIAVGSGLAGGGAIGAFLKSLLGG